MIFDRFTSLAIQFHLSFWEYLPSMCHASPGFREMAFAVVSLAAGHFYLERPDRLYQLKEGSVYDGYLIETHHDAPSTIVPTFGSFCHAAGQWPGSAPLEPLYWFENIVISLVPDSVFEIDMEAAVAQATEFGLKSGRGRFRIVLLSIFRAILVRVNSEGEVIVIEQSPVVSMNDRRTRRRSNSTCDGDCKITALDEMILKNTGFRTLQTFISHESELQLPKSGGVFPPEIYARIIEKADFETRRTCETVSEEIRSLCRQQPLFSKTSTVLGFDVSTERLCRGGTHKKYVEPDELGTFTIKDHLTGRTHRSELSTEVHVMPIDFIKGKKFDWWCPVIGSGIRLQMMTQLQFRTEK